MWVGGAGDCGVLSFAMRQARPQLGFLSGDLTYAGWHLRRLPPSESRAPRRRPQRAAG